MLLLSGSRQCGGWEGAGVDPMAVEAGMEEEQACGVDPAAVGEAPVWTQWWSGRLRHGPDGGGGVEAVQEQVRRYQ
jgi:hypothetical protein